MPFASRRKVPGCVRRDLNTDVSVLDWHARLRLAPRWRLAVAKGLRENCRDVGRALALKVHTVTCHPALFEIWWPDIYLGGPYGPVKDKMYWSGSLKSGLGQRASAHVEGCATLLSLQTYEMTPNTRVLFGLRVTRLTLFSVLRRVYARQISPVKWPSRRWRRAIY